MENKIESDIKNNTTDFCKVYSNPLHTTYNIYFSHFIDNTYNFHEFFETLRKATKEDNINIHINSPGGYLNCTMQIINAMNECKALITTIIEGEACSAGSIIFLCGDIKIVKTYGIIMCHYFSGIVHGKGNEIVAKTTFYDKYYKSFFKKIYKNFLTDEEINRLIKGEDFWFSSDEIKKRLNNGIS
jgi:ATP-dependent Clp protease, protease subunit